MIFIYVGLGGTLTKTITFYNFSQKKSHIFQIFSWLIVVKTGFSPQLKNPRLPFAVRNILGVLFLGVFYCGGLALAGRQVPTQPLSYSFPTGGGERIR